MNKAAFTTRAQLGSGQAALGSGKSAFTLVEILVATALFLMLAVLLVAATEGVTSLSSQTSKRLEVERIGRETFDLIGRDISVMALPWSRSATNSLQFLANPSGLPSDLKNPHTIFWQAPLSRGGTNAYGNLATVGYCVLRDLQTEGAKSRLQLRRVMVEPEAPGSAVKYKIYDSPSSWIDSPAVREFAPVSSQVDKGNAYKGWVADGVLAMWVRCLDRSGRPIVLDSAGNTVEYDFNSRAGYRSSGSIDIDRFPANYLVVPAFVEIALVCVAPADVPKIVNIPPTNASSPLNFDQEVLAFANAVRTNNPAVKSLGVFTRKFRIYGGF